MSLRPVRSRRHRFSYRQRASLNSQWQSHWNWKPSRKNLLGLFGRKSFVIALSLLIILIGGLVMYSDPNNLLFHSYQRDPNYHGYDPTTLLWQSTGQSGNNAEFNTRGYQATYGTTAFDSCTNCKDIALLSNSTLGTEALTNSSITSLSQSAAKDLMFSFNFYLIGNPTQNVPFYYFLTTDGRISSDQLNYNPLNDKNVVFALQFSCISHCSSVPRVYSVVSFLQLKPGDSINSELPTGVCTSSSSCYLNFQTPAIAQFDPLSHIILVQQYLNYTGGTTQNTPCSGQILANYGAGCSVLLSDDATGGGYNLATTLIQPTLLAQPNYYVGIMTMPNLGSQLVTLYDVGTYSNNAGSACLDHASAQFLNVPPCNVRSLEADLVLLISATPTAPPPTIDTGGFFGPVIKALTSIGVFMFNTLLGFISFILPAMQDALGVLENVLTQVLNFLGNLLWPGSNLGTLLAGFLNAIIQLFTNTSYGLPAFFANFPSYFTNFLSWLQITFPFLAPMFSIANAILGFAVSVVPTGVTIMTLGLQMFLFGYGTLILASFFIYTGDDGIGGFLTFLGTLEALSFKILNIIATLTNLGLDILVIIVSLIPKPLIQMSASKLPRLPTLETGASMSFPVMDLGEARNGNMVVYWLWSMGLYMLAWFESRNPSLPGSIGAIYAPLATNMRILSAYLPLLQAMVLISGGLLLAWTAMMPLRTIGFDIMGLSPFGVSLGRRTGAGPSTVKLAVSKKHVVGPAAKAEKERRRQKEFEAKKEEEARKGIVKHAKTEEEKRRSEELRKKEIERKPTGKDIKGPDLT